LQTLAGLLQLLGLGLALFGVAVARSWLEIASDKAIDAKHGLDRWWAISREQLRSWWRRQRGRIDATVFVPSAAASGFAPPPTPTGDRPRVNREAVSDREWLLFLDDRVEAICDQVEAIYKRLDESDTARRADRGQVRDQLAAQHDELRAEIQRETRQGWQIIVAGLFWSAAGTVVGIV
jgi:hypothetical protein